MGFLWYAMRKVSPARVPEDKRVSIIACRNFANQLIQNIQSTWHKPWPCQMAGWCATWQLYQATMVPLLSLFCDCAEPDVVQDSIKHVEVALSALTDLERWSPTAKRSHEVVSRLYEAGRAFHARELSRAAPGLEASSLASLDT